jgi:hypothetical protein
MTASFEAPKHQGTEVVMANHRTVRLPKRVNREHRAGLTGSAVSWHFSELNCSMQPLGRARTLSLISSGLEPSLLCLEDWRAP